MMERLFTKHFDHLQLDISIRPFQKRDLGILTPDLEHYFNRKLGNAFTARKIYSPHHKKGRLIKTGLINGELGFLAECWPCLSDPRNDEFAMYSNDHRLELIVSRKYLGEKLLLCCMWKTALMHFFNPPVARLIASTEYFGGLTNDVAKQVDLYPLTLTNKAPKQIEMFYYNGENHE